ncbi:odorant receptor 43a isoform X2 [Monomorium pharaonis]|uniref:odorant receptor 43a isoform X2 n=1 Tax=Monomorium pharaonis TaxID=307658 RepID=UPI00063FBDD5|nr:odorant receptor 43a isoform X2 [Monomorium pharaonis]
MSILTRNLRKRTTIEASLLRYRMYTRRVRRMLYLGCVLQDRTRSATWSYITGFLVILMCFSQCVFLINFCRDHTDNLVLILKCFGMTCSFIAPVLMSACFLVKRKKLMELHETLNELFERELARDQETKTTVLAAVCAFDRPSYVLCFTLGSTALLVLYPSLISIVHQIIRREEPKRYRLPLPNKFPWPVPVDGGVSFYLHLLYQIFTLWWVVITVGSVDSLFGYYAFQISSILRAMSARLANPRIREVFTESLATCIQTHHRLLQCGHILSDIWGLIIIRMVVMNALLICALIFEASPFTHLTISKIFLFISYMALKLLQTFIYAWYGSLITSASEHFRDGIYFSEWPESSLDRNIRTNVILTMMQKPIIIKALKLSSVNVNMFTTIVNTAMSYFFLLQSLDEDR